MEAHVLRIVSRGKTPATGRLEHLPKLWLHAPVRFELACAAPEDTEAALDDTPTYSISIHSLDASRNPVDSPLVWYSEVDAEGNTDKSKGPHAVFELSAADIANVTEAGEYWLAFHAYSGGERIVRAAGYLTFSDDGFPTDPPTPTPPGTVYLTQAAGDARYVRDPGTVVDNRLVRWDGTSGNQVQSSLVTVNDAGNISTPGTFTANRVKVKTGAFEGEVTSSLLTDDRAHALPDADGTYALTGETDGKVKLIDLKDVTITTPSTGHVLTWNGTLWVNAAPSGGGGGGSVTITGNDGIGVAGSPGTSITLSLGNITPDSVTSAGVIAADGGLTIGTSAEKITFSLANVGAASTVFLPEFGGNLATVSGINGAITAGDVTDATTVGRNILKLTNPGAVTFLRMNADNTVTALSDSSMRSALGLGNVATRNVGTTTGTAAAGDDSRFHAPVTLNASLGGVFQLSTQQLQAVTDIGEDRIVFLDQSANAIAYLTVGAGLSIVAQTLTVNSGGTGSEIQFRDSATGALAAVAGSSVSLAGAVPNIVLGGADNLGPTVAERLRIQNTSPAVSGTPQYSPALAFEGEVFQASAGSSQAVEMRCYLIPQPGASLAAGRLVFEFRLNGGAWTEIASFRSGFTTSGLFLGTGTAGNIVTSSTSLGIYTATNQFVMSVSNTGGHVVGPFSIRSGANDATLAADAAHQLALRSGVNAQSLAVYDRFVSDTDYHRLRFRTVRASLTGLSGASVTIAGIIPAGATVMGVTAKVGTAITGATSWQLGTAADPDRFAAAGGIALGSSTDTRNWTSGVIECFPSGSDLVLTANGGPFTGGAIYVSVQFSCGECD